MTVKINSIHFKSDRKLDLFIEDKVSKLEKYFDGVYGTVVTLKLDNNDEPKNKIADIKIEIPGNDLFVSKQSESFEESTQLAVDALKKQLLKRKEKLHSK